MENKVLIEVTGKLEELKNSGGEFCAMMCFYNKHGKYIGNAKDLKAIVIDRGISPETISDDSNTCSIGRSLKDDNWYGWSHRAIYGFKIGDTVREGDCCAEELGIGFWAQTDKDCMKMAIAFANSVS
jgi:hypothetical protein